MTQIIRPLLAELRKENNRNFQERYEVTD